MVTVVTRHCTGRGHGLTECVRSVLAAVRRTVLGFTTRAFGQAPRGAGPIVEPIGRVARSIMCDRTCLVAVGAL
jgi:hypothetical protein